MLQRLALVLTTALLPHSNALQETVDARADYNLDEGLALAGHDPVAYFPEGGGAPLEGKRELGVRHAGITYRFASKENRELFLSSPTRYEPAYGGWCAWAMREGDKVEVDPESFLVQDERLLLFYDGFLADTRKKWMKSPESYLVESDVEWLELAHEQARDTQRFHLGEDGLALAGRDPVGYFAQDAAANGPSIGSAMWETVYLGVRYRFATPENRLRFVEEPARYEPAYGGWCALAMAKGERVPADPASFTVDEGRLFLFAGADARKTWSADASGNRTRADAGWKRLTAQVGH